MKNTIAEYITSFPPEIRVVLEEVRVAIATAAPAAEECISYSMPAFKLNGKPLVYFAGYKNHIGFYALPTGHAEFKDALAKYKQGKGSVQFPLNENMPIALIKKIVKFRVKEVKASLKK